MKFSYWIDYPSMSIAIQVDNNTFRCVKFVEKKVVRGAERIFDSVSDLEAFLSSLPYPPQEQISEVLEDLIVD
ncbi:MAG: hypothetical protein R2780_14195 [Crocinitomicaceae bacterium]